MLTANNRTGQAKTGEAGARGTARSCHRRADIPVRSKRRNASSSACPQSVPPSDNAAGSNVRAPTLSRCPAALGSGPGRALVVRRVLRKCLQEIVQLPPPFAEHPHRGPILPRNTLAHVAKCVGNGFARFRPGPGRVLLPAFPP